MFIYLVFPVATLFIIFGVLHDRNDWLRSSVRRTLTLYRRLINRCTTQRSLLNENITSVTSERSVDTTGRTELDDVPAQKTAVSKIADHTKERDAIFGEVEAKIKTLNTPRYSFESTLSEEKDTDLGLPVIRTLPLGKTQDNATRISKPEETKNVFESLETTIEKSIAHPSTRLNTKQIYNLLMKETLKENEARQSLIDNDKKLNELFLTEIKEQVPSSSENKQERENKDK
ncbi:hypothetical protein ANTQUA_LOCUS2008 [Anthophora quadrimaculata]